jgi:hypothetical protein
MKSALLLVGIFKSLGKARAVKMAVMARRLQVCLNKKGAVLLAEL